MTNMPPAGWTTLEELSRGSVAVAAQAAREALERKAREAKVAVSPGSGFGPGGDKHVRFALVENEQRILQAIRSIRRALPELAAVRQ